MPGTDDPTIRSLQNKVAHLENRMEQFEQYDIALSHLVVALSEEHDSVDSELPEIECPERETESLAALVDKRAASRQSAGSSTDDAGSVDDSY